MSIYKKIRKRWEFLFKKYHIVIYTNNPSELTRNYHIPKFKIISYFILFIIFLITLTTIILVFTPVYKIMGKEVMDDEKIKILEERMAKLNVSVTKLQNFNNHIRYALGDTSFSSQNFDLDKFLKQNQFETSSTISEKSPNPSFRSETLDIFFSTPIINYVISQTFDESSSHFGIDFAGKSGEPISAVADGYVIFSDWTQDYGYSIYILHGTNYITTYKHNSCNFKLVGNYVRRGEIIGLLGNTGKLSTSPHLHFEIWKNGVAKNPNDYLFLKK